MASKKQIINVILINELKDTACLLHSLTSIYATMGNVIDLQTQKERETYTPYYTLRYNQHTKLWSVWRRDPRDRLIEFVIPPEFTAHLQPPKRIKRTGA